MCHATPCALSGWIADGQFKEECGAFPFHGIEADPAAHVLDQLLGDGQPQTSAAFPPRVGCIRLRKLVKDMGAKVFWNTRAKITH